MSDTLYVAFPASETLCQRIDAFLAKMRENPSGNHAADLDGITDPFIDEVLHTYFTGPIEAVNARGTAVNMIMGAMKVIRKAAHGLAGRLMRKASVEEQQALAQHFSSLRLEKDGGVFVGYPLPADLAERANRVFESFANGEGEMAHLVEVMHGITDGAIENYLDKTLGSLKLGAINRGLVSTARATINKASTSAVDKGLPAMERSHRKPVVAYYQSLLHRFG
ncbi:hypothetical protein B5T_02231 [Alloalcanivorax dieselolei B5]|uniref:Uncharacterized protein n=1 Tax=Alcanivorax dieselolei (strain DSM 16502 / CGMCC 1.3690 / MCCC 1A00001 / B-5) TaxID=930169 RepID=K0CDJ8_ALCDB|nr:hypothetical protein [Alloalcanivorax dieselolei]AFT70505.1 hypothetical protein B5T_02231 [Alloalcanivorax dieselolei B5]GGJ84860.1 hypothetical protein GCM10007426_12410 [Alloalcanivorax dieselolei]